MPKTAAAAPVVSVDPALKPLLVPLDSVQPWEANPRQGDVGAISESLRRFGQRKPIVTQKSSRRIVAGNHTWKAAKALGWTHIAVVFADLGDEDAAAYAIADNRTSDLAQNDEAQLAELLKRLVADGGEAALTGTGFDGDDLEALLKKLEREGQSPAEFAEVDGDIDTAYRCPKCGYEWSGKPK